MKKLLLSVFIIASLILSALGQKTQFSKSSDLQEDECVVYIYRLKSMVGGAVKWPVISYEYDESAGSFLKNEVKKHGKINKMEYMPLVLKADQYHWITIGQNLHVVFSGTKGSETIIKLKGLKSETAAIAGESMTRSNSDSGFKVANGDFPTWAKKIKGAESYQDLEIKKGLLDFEFEILKANEDSPLYGELKTMRPVKK